MNMLELVEIEEQGTNFAFRMLGLNLIYKAYLKGASFKY